MYSISQFAKLISVSQGTLRRWDKEGKLKPVLLASGHRRYTDEHLAQINGRGDFAPARQNIIYVRESTHSQIHSLEAQELSCRNFCEREGLKIDQVISDLGSALNYKRAGLLKLLGQIIDGSVDTVIIYHKDRLVRFGFDLIKWICDKRNTKLVVIDSTDGCKTKQQEFTEDLISIVHHFSMKLYGSRSYKKHEDADSTVR